jgi:glycosyltransferase 2 family protein
MPSPVLRSGGRRARSAHDGAGAASLTRERQSLDSRAVVPSGWRAVIALGAAVLLVVGVGLLIARAAGFSQVREAVERADSRWFVLCLAAQVLALAAYADVVRGAFRWRDGPDPGFGVSARVMLASIGAARVFAAGGLGAIAASYWCFRRARFSAEDSLARVLGFNAIFYVPFGIGAWVAVLLAATGVWGAESLALTGPWLVGVPVIFVAAALVAQPRRLEALTRPGASAVRRALASAVAALCWVREVLVDAAGRRLALATALFWVGNVVCLWAALRSVGETLPLPELVIGFALGQVAMVLPLPLGGVGGVDAAMTYALTAVGVPLAPALVAVGVYRLFAFWAPTIPALVALALLPRTGRRLGRLGVPA